MSNVTYRFDGRIGYGILNDGTTFIFDVDRFDRIRNSNWYRNRKNSKGKVLYIINRSGTPIHSYLLDCPKGCEVDHISNNTLDNRMCNLRIVTHQQNQINQPLQKNNTSGFSGVRYYAPRKKYTARVKICQHDVHLGYYLHLEEAVQARNVGMACLFGEYGRYNDVPPAPPWIEKKVVEICKRFANLSVCEAFFNAYASEVA